MNEKQYYVIVEETTEDFENQIDFVFDDFLEVVKFTEICLSKAVNKSGIAVKIGLV